MLLLLLALAATPVRAGVSLRWATVLDPVKAGADGFDGETLAGLEIRANEIAALESRGVRDLDGLARLRARGERSPRLAALERSLRVLAPVIARLERRGLRPEDGGRVSAPVEEPLRRALAEVSAQKEERSRRLMALYVDPRRPLEEALAVSRETDALLRDGYPYLGVATLDAWGKVYDSRRTRELEAELRSRSELVAALSAEGETLRDAVAEPPRPSLLARLKALLRAAFGKGPPALEQLFLAGGAEGQATAVPPVAPVPVVERVALDAHWHFTDKDSWDETAPELKTIAGIQAAMDEAGVERAFLISNSYLMTEADGAARHGANAELAAFVAAHPGRFHGFCGVDISWSDAAQVARDCLALPGMIGVKLHPETKGQDLTHPGHRARLGALLDAARPYGALFMIHAGYKNAAGEVASLLDAFRRRPELTLVVAHAASGYPAALSAWKGGLRGSDNVLAETSGFDPLKFSAALDAFGRGRLLFGSDMSVRSPKRALERLEDAKLSARDRELLLRGNGAALLAKLTARARALSPAKLSP